MPAYDAVVFTKPEAQFVESTMQAYSQNQAAGGETDNGAAVPITGLERQKALNILSKVHCQVMDESQLPISFTSEEAALMSYLYINYLQGHGKAQGDLSPTYWITFDVSAQALIISVLKKIGCNVNIMPSNRYPFSGPKPSYND